MNKKVMTIDCKRHKFGYWIYKSNNERARYCSHKKCNVAEYELNVDGTWMNDIHKQKCILCQANTIMSNKQTGGVEV